MFEVLPVYPVNKGYMIPGDMGIFFLNRDKREVWCLTTQFPYNFKLSNSFDALWNNL